VTKWKHEFLDRATTVFENEVPDQKESEKKKQELYSKIGELQVQVDFLKKVLGK
jgi:transposase